MQCNCREEVEKRLTERAKEGLPDGYERFDANMGGYTLLMIDSGLDERVYLEFTGEVQVPKKAGGMKRQKIKQNILASYCPFCGKPAEPSGN